MVDSEMSLPATDFVTVQRAAYDLLQEELRALRRQVFHLKHAKLLADSQIDQQTILLNLINQLQFSVDLKTIFQLITTEVRQFLKVDRVAIFRFELGSEYSRGEFVAEDKKPEYESIIQAGLEDNDLTQESLAEFAGGKINIICDINQESLNLIQLEKLSRWQVKAGLVFPIFWGEDIWGLFYIHQCQNSRQWQPEEIEWVRSLLFYFSARVQQVQQWKQTHEQAEQLQKLNQQLELKVQQRVSDWMQVNQALYQEVQTRQKINQKLTVQESRLRNIATHLPGAIFQFIGLNEVWKVDYISEGIYPLAGITASEMMEDFNCFIERVHPEDLQDYLASVSQVIKTLTPWHYEGRLIQPSGEIRWWQGKSTPVKYEQNKIIFCGILLDITDRKIAEESLKKLNEELEATVEQRTAQFYEKSLELQAILDAFPDLFFCMTLDSTIVDYQVGNKNPQLFVSPEVFMNQKMLDLLPPAASKKLQQALLELKETKSLVSLEYVLPIAQNYEYYEGRLLPFGLDKVILIVRNISDRKQAELALQHSEQRFRCLIEATSQIIWDTKTEGEFISKQPAWSAFTGQSFEELKGWGWLNAVHPEDQKNTADIWSKAVANCTFYQVEHRLRRYDGEYRYMSVKAVPVLNIDGSIREWIGTHTDITERKQTETQLKQQAQDLEQMLHKLQQAQIQLVQSEKMSALGQLVAGVAHEINNPVNFIHGNLIHATNYVDNLLQIINAYQITYPNSSSEIEQLIEDTELEFLREDLPKLLNSMKVGTNRIREIITSLRNFSRLDEAEMKEVNLHEGIDSTLMILQNRLKAKSYCPEIKVIKNYAQLPKIPCYLGPLNQVFMNILVNAIDALEERDKTRTFSEIQQNPSIIWITTELIKSQQIVRIMIRDNGPGLSDKTRLQIFDPFFTTKSAGQGTGLGMSISYQIVTEKHHGILECVSSPGEGATFIIQLPLSQNPNSAS